MTPEAHRRLGHALQAIKFIHAYTGSAPLPECLADDLTRSAVERQLGIVQEALRVVLEELVGFVAGDLQLWQGRLLAGVEQAGLGGKAGSADGREFEEVGI